jgi:anti-sigma factor RsiW
MSGQLSCAEFVELVTAYLEDALDDDTRTRFEDHLALCPGCVTYVDQFRETIDQLGDAPTPTLPPETEEQLLEAFRSWHR